MIVDELLYQLKKNMSKGFYRIVPTSGMATFQNNSPYTFVYKQYPQKFTGEGYPPVIYPGDTVDITQMGEYICNAPVGMWYAGFNPWEKTVSPLPYGCTCSEGILEWTPAGKLNPPRKYTTGMTFCGVNISGAEAGSGNNLQYAFVGIPTIADVDVLAKAGMNINTVRVPINWGYITESADTPVQRTPEYLKAIHHSVHGFLEHGYTVILDLHDYMRYNPPDGNPPEGTEVTATQIKTVWTLLATTFNDLAGEYTGQHNPELIYEIMNEPCNMETEKVLSLTKAAISAIKQTGYSNSICVEGNHWSGLHSWKESGNEVITPDNLDYDNIVIAVHQYVDDNYSGTSPKGKDPAAFQEGLHFEAFMEWVHTYQVKVILDEFGSGTDANDKTNIEYLLKKMNENPCKEGGFIGWTVWVSGHTWTLENFNTLIKKDGDSFTPTEQVGYYTPYLTPSQT